MSLMFITSKRVGDGFSLFGGAIMSYSSSKTIYGTHVS